MTAKHPDAGSPGDDAARADPAAASAGDKTQSAHRMGWMGVAIAIAFGLLYAYQLFAAIGNLLGITADFARYNEVARENDLQQLTVPWFALVAQLVIPPLAYVIAFILGKNRNLLITVLLFAAGLAVSAALYLSLNVLGAMIAA